MEHFFVVFCLRNIILTFQTSRWVFHFQLFLELLFYIFCLRKQSNFSQKQVPTRNGRPKILRTGVLAQARVLVWGIFVKTHFLGFPPSGQMTLQLVFVSNAVSCSSMFNWIPCVGFRRRELPVAGVSPSSVVIAAIAGSVAGSPYDNWEVRSLRIPFHTSSFDSLQSSW